MHRIIAMINGIEHRIVETTDFNIAKSMFEFLVDLKLQWYFAGENGPIGICEHKEYYSDFIGCTGDYK